MRSKKNENKKIKNENGSEGSKENEKRENQIKNKKIDKANEKTKRLK